MRSRIYLETFMFLPIVTWLCRCINGAALHSIIPHFWSLYDLVISGMIKSNHSIGLSAILAACSNIFLLSGWVVAVKLILHPPLAIPLFSQIRIVFPLERMVSIQTFFVCKSVCSIWSIRISTCSSFLCLFFSVISSLIVCLPSHVISGYVPHITALSFPHITVPRYTAPCNCSSTITRWHNCLAIWNAWINSCNVWILVVVWRLRDQTRGFITTGFSSTSKYLMACAKFVCVSQLLCGTSYLVRSFLNKYLSSIQPRFLSIALGLGRLIKYRYLPFIVAL